MARIRDGFAATAHRAVCLELDYFQLQTAHAYLLHGFLSPISNPRDDDYGGSPENRIRFPLNVFDAVRQAFRPDRPVTVRITATDWMAGGWSIDDSLAFVDGLKDTWLRRYLRVERRQDLATIDPDWAELPGSAPAGGEAGK